jgi:hypothetical protein
MKRNTLFILFFVLISHRTFEINVFLASNSFLTGD